MFCPRCREKTVVINSRETINGVRRRRECPNCGLRFTTKELVWLEEMTDCESRLKRKVALLQASLNSMKDLLGEHDEQSTRGCD